MKIETRSGSGPEKVFENNSPNENGMIFKGILKGATQPVSEGNTGKEHNLKDSEKQPLSWEKNCQIVSEEVIENNFPNENRRILKSAMQPVKERTLKDSEKQLFSREKNCQIVSEGIVLVNKPAGKTSFSLVAALRKLTKIDKIGHAGTLDPFARGVMILLVGRKFTRQADTFLNHDKEYEATVRLGIETTTYDPEGEIVSENDRIPTLEEIERALTHFQGTIQQLPPMFSAKKVKGKKLYELARKGIEIERMPCTVTLKTDLLNYAYPYLNLKVTCSKGTYIRSLAHDLGAILNTGAHLSALTRTRSGPYLLADCMDGDLILKGSHA